MAKRHTVDTYFRVSNRLAKCKPLSVRKEFCLAYLKWLYTAETKDRDQFVELAKKLRKIEMKVGQPRTLLESRALQSFGGREFDASLGGSIAKNRCTASVDTICEHVGAYVFTMLLQVIQKNTHDMVCFRFQNFPLFR